MIPRHDPLSVTKWTVLFLAGSLPWLLILVLIERQVSSM